MSERLDPQQSAGSTLGQTVPASRPTPNIEDLILKLEKPARGAELPPTDYGIPHDDPRYPDHKLAKIVPDGTGTTETWYYVADRAGQDDYNYAITFSGDNENYPIYTRTYILLRLGYTPLDHLTQDPGNGQCLLVSEKMADSTGVAELDSLYVKVTRVFEVLPGPWLPFTRYDENLGPIQGNKRAVISNDQAPSLTGTTKTTYEARDGSDIVSWEITETWSNGTGGAGNPAYPIGVSNYWDDDRAAAIHSVSQLVVATGTEAGSQTETGGIVTKTKYEPFAENPALLRKTVETWNAAGAPYLTRQLGQDNLTPEKYRRLVRHTITNQPVDKDYTFPSGLVGDQSQIELAQYTIQQARLKITEEVINVASDPLTGGETSEWGSYVIKESIVVDGTPIDEAYLVKRSTVTPIGNGKSIRITVFYPDTLPTKLLLRKTLGQDNLLPEKYRKLVLHTETTKIVDPTAYSFPTSLGTDETLVEYIQEAVRQARLKTVKEIIDTSVDPLTGQATDPWGTVSITEEVVNDGTPALTGFSIKDSRVSPLGNGKSIRITVHWPATLTEDGSGTPPTLIDKSIGQDNLTPQKYRRLLQHTETSKRVNPHVFIFPTALTGNQTEVSMQQEAIDMARLKIVEEVIGTGGALQGQESNEHGTVGINESIVPDGTPADPNPPNALTDHLVLKSTVSPLGNGKSIKITIFVAGFRNLAAATVDEEYNFVNYSERQVVAAGTLGGILEDAGGFTLKSTEVIDAFRSQQVKKFVTKAELEAFIQAMPGRTNVDLPVELVSTTAYAEGSTVNGFNPSSSEPYAHDSGNFAYTDTGNAETTLHAESEGSASLIPGIFFEPKIISGNNVPCMNYLLLWRNNATEADIITRILVLTGLNVNPWPLFQPRQEHFICEGASLTNSVTAKAHGMIRRTVDFKGLYIGEGSAFSVGSFVKNTLSSHINEFRIPPTIHPALDLGNYSSPIELTFLTRAIVNGGIGGTVLDTGDYLNTVRGIITPGGVPATLGRTTIPTTGLYLADLRPEPYKYKYVKFHATVVKFTSAGIVSL